MHPIVSATPAAEAQARAAVVRVLELRGLVTMMRLQVVHGEMQYKEKGISIHTFFGIYA